jgi:hypothetical protein
MQEIVFDRLRGTQRDLTGERQALATAYGMLNERSRFR